jgi:hypothetical protein
VSVAKRVFLHIGTPKSGTTYLQTLLWANKKRLADVGVLIPGRVKFDHNRYAQAVRNRNADARSKRAWRQMLREVQAWPGTVVLSNEWFCMANENRARRAVESFGSAEVHVVVTARDLVSTVPSAWQETLKLGKARPVSDFIASLEDSSTRWRWPTLDPALILATWQLDLPPERLHLVTLKPGGGDRTELMRRFAEACDFEPDSLDLSVSTPNESIGAESARLLEIAGPRLRLAIDAENAVWTEPYKWIREYVGHQLLVPRKGTRIGLRSDHVGMLRERSQQSVKQIATGGYDIVGSLDELTAAQMPPDAVYPEDVEDAVVLGLSVDVMADLLGQVRDETHRANREAKRARQVERHAHQLEEELGRMRRPSSRVRALAASGLRRLRAGTLRSRRD